MTHNAHDPVNSPSHYTEGRKFEVIDVLEDAVSRAPNPVLGALQWQTLKYLNRLWDKGNPEQDAQKAMWYLMRLIDKLAERPAAWDTADPIESALELDAVSSHKAHLRAIAAEQQAAQSYNPGTLAECGGPCYEAMDPGACDCGQFEPTPPRGVWAGLRRRLGQTVDFFVSGNPDDRTHIADY